MQLYLPHISRTYTPLIMRIYETAQRINAESKKVITEVIETSRQSLIHFMGSL